MRDNGRCKGSDTSVYKKSGAESSASLSCCHVELVITEGSHYSSSATLTRLLPRMQRMMSMSAKTRLLPALGQLHHLQLPDMSELHEVCPKVSVARPFDSPLRFVLLPYQLWRLHTVGSNNTK